MENVPSSARERSFYTDFSLISENGRDETTVFPVHKLILILHSLYFQTFFEAEMNKDKQSMVIVDGSPHSVDIFISFIYKNTMNLDDLQPSLNTLKEVIILAHQYMVQPLIMEIITYCIKILSPLNSIDLYEFSGIFENDPVNLRVLQEECIKRLLIDGTVLKTEAFLKSKVKTIRALLSDDDCSWNEEEIWGAVVNWCKYKCKMESAPQTSSNIRSKLEGGGILSLIKFGSFSKTGFLEGPAKSNILNREEINYVKDILDGVWVIDGDINLDTSTRSRRRCTCGMWAQGVWHVCDH